MLPTASAALLAALLMILCVAVARATLGTVIGALTVITLLAPLLVSGETHGRARTLSSVAILAGVATVLAFAAFQGGWGWSGWARISLVIALYEIALLGIFALLMSARISASISAAAVVLIGFCWLTWPFWMAPWLKGGQDEQMVSTLAATHPVMAINGALRDLFPIPWAQQRLAYRLTSIGDDVMYEMPTSIGWCAGIHALIGNIALTLTLTLTHRHGRQRLTADSPPHPPAD